MSDIRKPIAIRLETHAAAAPARKPTAPENLARAPRAAPAMEIVVEPDVFATEMETATAPVVTTVKKRWSFGSVLFGALSLLVSLAAGLWIDQLIRDLFSRADWLGWLAAAAAASALLALVVIAGRELIGLRNLGAVEALRLEGAEAIRLNNSEMAKAVTAKLDGLLASNSATARGRALLAGQREEIMDGRDRIHLAEQALLKPLDDAARSIILESSKRVSVVTAVSPRALVDIAYVIYEAARLIRRLAELYGGRPGTIGMFKLSRAVIAHLAVTGSIAVGDSLVQQLVGHGVAARLSARLGEGVINGLMTARIGISAMDLVRPLAFEAEKRPGIGDFLSDITSLAKGSDKSNS